MTTVQSLEQERQAILDRMQMRRESYRRMLVEGEDFRKVSMSHDGMQGDHISGYARSSAGSTPHSTAVYSYTRAMPRTKLMQVVSEHPVLCALGVATVLAIGPRRLVRSVASSGAALSAVTMDQSRMDMLGRVLSLVGSITQRRS